MKLALAVLTFAVALDSHAADPVYLDQLMETPLASLQTQFPGLKKEGCYRVGEGRYVLLSIDKKDGKPWRVAVTSEPPCKRPDEAAAMDVQARKGLQLGDRTLAVVEKMGRPDASAPPETSLRKLGDIEYFYVCRVSEQCARHTSVFIRDGVVTALAEWYSK
ncbi:MAG TPA: hypothetical protein VE010_03865 [Thermoanaerobaculia bacterium]|nr:hypothetical protein [Thermoanaerobaculia bacterium]